MKIRLGFVSNSSSSSFVLVTTRDNWEHVKKQLSSLQVRVAEAIMTEGTLAGMDVVMFLTFADRDGTDWVNYVKTDILEDGYNVYEAWETVEGLLLKQKEGLVITRSEDW